MGANDLVIGPSEWTLDSTVLPRNLVATVGTTIMFSWSGTHNVYIHPSGTCDENGAIPVADGSVTSGSYTFTDSDVGKNIYFACDIASHCEDHGMHVSVFVAAAGGDGPVLDDYYYDVYYGDDYYADYQNPLPPGIPTGPDQVYEFPGTSSFCPCAGFESFRNTTV